MIFGSLVQKLKSSALGRYLGGIGDFASTVSKDGSLSSLVAKFTGSHLTGAEREANVFSASQAELQRQFQEEMYNQYQSPAAMMRQYQEAGLNPALMYGSAPSNAMSSNVSAPTSVSPGAGLDLVGSLISMMSAKANIRKTAAEAEGQEIENQFKETLLSADIATKWAQAENLIRQSEKSVAEKDKITADISEVVARTGLYNAEKAESIARAGLIAVEKALRETENDNAVKQGALLDNQVFVSTFEKNFVNTYGSTLSTSGSNIILRAVLRVLGERTGELPPRDE